jgi:pyrimidine operon attenuation protein/uracil phosphoribosyltransferase
MREVAQLMDARHMEAAIADIADRIMASPGFDHGDLAFLGIRRRGIPLAERIAACVGRRHGVEVPIGELDITLYRDDLSQLADQPIVGVSDVPFPLDGKLLVLVDDVLYTGRTIRAALSALADYGRPRAVWLAVLVDRGLRELPIQPDFCGLKRETTPGQVVEVKVKEVDGEDRVSLVDDD